MRILEALNVFVDLYVEVFCLDGCGNVRGHAGTFGYVEQPPLAYDIHHHYCRVWEVGIGPPPPVVVATRTARSTYYT